MIKLIQWLTRIAGLGALVIGAMLSIGLDMHALGRSDVALPLHMTLGGIVALMLAILAVWALIDRVRIPAAMAALVWAAAVVYVGTIQDWWVGAGSHPVIEIVHPLLGIGAIGLAEMLAAAITRKRASLV